MPQESLPTIPAAEPDAAAEARVVAKVMWRLIPIMILLYLLNYMDRVNVSFAKLQMNADLGMNDAVYGFGASIFFVGYFLFEVPSNLIMEKVGARVWIARIMVTWGLVSAAMVFVKGATSFYLLRLLLGIAEAGFFPGMILYLTYWIPVRQRARAVAWFFTSTALAGILGGPLAGMLLRVHGGGLTGWQWLFLLEGLPSVVMGLGVFFLLTDRPEQASWLTPAERALLTSRLHAERTEAISDGDSARHAFTDPRVWLLAILYASIMFGFNGMNYWTASIIKATTAASDTAVSLLSAIPYVAAAAGMVVVGRFADVTGRRRTTVAISALIGALGLSLATITASPTAVIAALSLAALGIWGTIGPFWAMPGRFLRGAAAAAGIGIINSVGNLGGGFIGQNVMGRLKERYHSYNPGLWVLSAVVLCAAIIACLFTASPDAERDAPPV